MGSKEPVLPASLVGILDFADIYAEVDDIEEMDVDWDGTVNY